MLLYLLVILMLTCKANFTSTDRPESPQTGRPTVEQCEKCRRRTDLKCDPTRNANGHVNCKCISINKKNDQILHCKDRLDEPKCKVFCEAHGICFRDPNELCDENKGDGTDGKNRSESTGQTSAILAPSTDVTPTRAHDKNVQNVTSAAIETTTENTTPEKTTRKSTTRTHVGTTTTPPQNETISPKESSGHTSAISETTMAEKTRSTTRTTVGTTTEKSRRAATSKIPSQRPTTSRTRATPPPTGLTIGNLSVVMSNSNSGGGNRLTLDVNLIQMLILIIQIYALA